MYGLADCCSAENVQCTGSILLGFVLIDEQCISHILGIQRYVKHLVPFPRETGHDGCILYLCCHTIVI